ncbi:MAG: hypothetical protein ACLR2G_06405 [Phascolarctobacterium faecium]
MVWHEAAAVLGTEFRMPDMSVQETAGGNAAEMAKVDVQAADLCSRFAVRILKNIKNRSVAGVDAETSACLRYASHQ